MAFGRVIQATAILDSGLRTKPTVTASTSGKTVIGMRANGDIVLGMDRAQTSSQTAMSILVNTVMVGLRATVSTDGPTVTLIVVCLKKE